MTLARRAGLHSPKMSAAVRRPPYIMPRMQAPLSWPDRLIATLDEGLRAIAAEPAAARPSPAAELPEADLTDDERRSSAALLRVNHAGEIAAQALYSGQALFARSDAAARGNCTRRRAKSATISPGARTRIAELGGRTSLLDPFWYAGSFCIGMIAGASRRRR